MTVKEAQDRFNRVISESDNLLMEVQYMLDTEELSEEDFQTLEEIVMSL